jgi:Phage major capsid protein E
MGTVAAAKRAPPGANPQARGSFEYGGIVLEEYHGRVGTVGFTDANTAYFFAVGVPGLFRQYNAPADFVETANAIGLPRYAKQAVDQQFAPWVMLHVQSNPLPIRTEPRVLIDASAPDDGVPRRWTRRLPRSGLTPSARRPVAIRSLCA